MQHPLVPETSFAIDALAALYNIMALHSKNAQDTDDLKVRGQELAKASYFAQLGVELTQKYSQCLQHVGADFGNGFFVAIQCLLQGECAETQAVNLSSKVDLAGEDEPFAKFIGLMAFANQQYKRADSLLLGLQNPDFKNFTSKRLQSVMCAMLYVNAVHISGKRASQALKDAMCAQDIVKNCDFVTFGDVNNLVQGLLQATA